MINQQPKEFFFTPNLQQPSFLGHNTTEGSIANYHMHDKYTYITHSRLPHTNCPRLDLEAGGASLKLVNLLPVQFLKRIKHSVYKILMKDLTWTKLRSVPASDHGFLVQTWQRTQQFPHTRQQISRRNLHSQSFKRRSLANTRFKSFCISFHQKKMRRLDPYQTTT